MVFSFLNDEVVKQSEKRPLDASDLTRCLVLCLLPREQKSDELCQVNEPCPSEKQASKHRKNNQFSQLRYGLLPSPEEELVSNSFCICKRYQDPRGESESQNNDETQGQVVHEQNRMIEPSLE